MPSIASALFLGSSDVCYPFTNMWLDRWYSESWVSQQLSPEYSESWEYTSTRVWCIPSWSASFIKHIIILAGMYAAILPISSPYLHVHTGKLHVLSNHVFNGYGYPPDPRLVCAMWVSFLIGKADNHRSPISYHTGTHGSPANAEIWLEAWCIGTQFHMTVW